VTEDEIERIVVIRLKAIADARLWPECRWTDEQYQRYVRAVEFWAEQRRAEQ
jgi:hypothetical protein